MVAFVMFLLSNPGRTMGLDGILFRSAPPRPPRRGPGPGKA
jgi:hypothetical protein